MAAEGFENFQTVVTSLAAVGAVYVAWLGLSTWKSQIVWSADRDVARIALKQLRKLEKQIKEARNPMFWTAEIVETKEKFDYLNDPGVSSDEVKEQAHRERLAKIAAVVDECEEAFDECNSLWGGHLDEMWTQLRRLVSRLFADVDYYLFLAPKYKETRDPALFGGDKERIRIYSVVFATPQEYDANVFSKELQESLGPLTQALRSKIGRL